MPRWPVVDQDPDAEPDDVEIDEGHPTGKLSDDVGDVFLHGALFPCLDMETGHRADVSLDDVRESRIVRQIRRPRFLLHRVPPAREILAAEPVSEVVPS
jgi:hypothetical protein